MAAVAIATVFKAGSSTANPHHVDCTPRYPWNLRVLGEIMQPFKRYSPQPAAYVCCCPRRRRLPPPTPGRSLSSAVPPVPVPVPAPVHSVCSTGPPPSLLFVVEAGSRRHVRVRNRAPPPTTRRPRPAPRRPASSCSNYCCCTFGPSLPPSPPALNPAPPPHPLKRNAPSQHRVGSRGHCPHHRTCACAHARGLSPHPGERDRGPAAPRPMGGGGWRGQQPSARGEDGYRQSGRRAG